MALTKAQWLAKLKSFVPSHLFEEELNLEAHFAGLAGVFAAIQEDQEDHTTETFILDSEGNFLDEHGNERSLKRVAGEVDPIYSERVRNIINQSNCPAIKALIDPFLINGESRIVEHWKEAPFVDRALPGRLGVFANRKDTFIDVRYNAFSILVDQQIPAPITFADRSLPGRVGSFCDRGDVGGFDGSSQKVFDLIVDAVNEVKALGTVYRVIEVL